jgi:hypothetical protein
LAEGGCGGVDGAAAAASLLLLAVGDAAL